MVIFALFSVKVFAFSTQYFPGPAQSPSNTDSLIELAGTSKIVSIGSKKIELGFSRFNIGQEASHCSDGLDAFPCIPNPSLRGDNRYLEPLVIGSGPQDLSKEALPVPGVNVDYNLTPNDPNYNEVMIGQYKTLNLTGGVYYFGDLTLNDSAKLNVNGRVEIHLNSFKASSNSTVNIDGDPDDLTIWVHGQKASLWEYDAFLASLSKTHAYIYAQGSVKLAGSSELRGAVTAGRFLMNNSASVTYEENKHDFKLVISPKSSVVSSCTRVPVSFSVEDTSGNLQQQLKSTLTVSITRSKELSCWAKSQDAPCEPGNTTSITLEGGRGQLWLQSDSNNRVSIFGETKGPDGNAINQIGGPYRFTPVGFRIAPNPSKMVAGKSEHLSLEAVASGGGNCEVVGDYEGLKKLHVDTTDYLEPQYLNENVAPHKIIISDLNKDRTKIVKFVAGRAENAFIVRYEDAGRVAFDVTDLDWKYRDDDDDDDDDREQGASERDAPEDNIVKGTANLDVRPYTLAVCDINASDKGHSRASDAFTYAGAPFSVNLKPVIWLDGDKDDESKINLWSEDYCSRPSTPSFWHVNAPEATVTIRNKAKIAFPVLGSSTNVEGAVAQSNIDAVNGVYAFPSLKVNDVGIFKLRSKVNGKYLDMKVNRGDMHIGRFYPSHFSLASTSKISPGVEKAYDEKGNGFTYLGQPFEGMFTVYAMTTQNKPVKNYHRYLDAGEKVSFTDWVIHSNSRYPYTGQDLSSRWSHPELPNVQWKSGRGGYSEVSIGGLMEIQKASSPDGPFEPLHFAVGVAQSDRDNTDFKYCHSPDGTNCVDKVQNPQSKNFGAEFGRGDFLFGRMRIEGFTETQDLENEQSLPVTVEVFNGSHFVTNERDNATNISTEAGVAQKDVLFSDTTVEADRAKIVLKNSANEVVQTKRVEKGTSVFHVIPPNQSKGPNREQFRFWQKLGAPTKSGLRQTWLQYRWQGDSFNEDPSAIGTFGFYRGSDRVIFKGEKNITLTGE
ncbi:hypothetical protein EH171_15405 [Enterovibrio baiacu]|nr:DUF6701 domain-containing protein [Enterovibrio baiacu]MBE1276275.1 hypothetical protein [Enterovibrio baiacu]